MSTHEPYARLRTTVLSIGRHRGQPRIYLEGRWLIDAGFAPGRSFDAAFSQGRIELSLADEGRTVSGKKQNRVAVIDLHCASIEQTFTGAGKVTVHAEHRRLIITAERIALQRAQRRLTDMAVSLFAGGGLLTEAARQAGFQTLAAVELDSRYADIYQLNHGGRLYACSIEQVPWEQLQKLVQNHGPLGLLEMGLPCEPYSRIRRLDRGGQSKRDRALPPEAHELGDLVYFAIKAVDLLNPHTVVLEEVPTFLDSGAGFILRGALRRLGYTVDARLINPIDHGGLTARARAVVVATTFDQVHWPEPLPADRRVGELFDDVPEDSDLWFDRAIKPWLYDHWQRQREKGNGFEPPRLTGEETRCPTIKKRYFAGQGDNVVVQHPRKSDTHRWLTLDEVRRLMTVPDHYRLGDAKTTAGEVLGQGVHVETFRRLIASVTGR
ncbi:MAG: DNA cytosine methyltransferase [Phycisphaeraceae bacterium]